MVSLPDLPGKRVPLRLHGTITEPGDRGAIASTTRPVEVAHDSAAQKRVIKVLSSAQVLGGIGVASGAAVGALLAADLSSDTFSGVASSASAVGAAFIAIPFPGSWMRADAVPA